MKALFSNKITKNIFWGAGGNAIMAAVSLVASVFVVRNLEPSEYGRLQEMLAYFLIFQNYENLINYNIFKKELLTHPEKRHDLVVTLGVLTSSVGFLLFVLVSLSVILFDLPTHFWFLAVFMFASVFRFSNGISYFFDSDLETKRNQISLNLGNLVACGYRVTASFLSPTAFFQAFSLVTQYLSTCIFHFFQYKKHKNKKKSLLSFNLKFKECYHLALVSFPFFLSSCVDVLKERIPYVYMGARLSPQEIGYFGAGVKLVEPWIFVASALCVSFWPKLVHSFKSSSESYKKSLTYCFAAVFYFFMSVALSEFFLSHFLIETVVGKKYLASVPILKLQCFALVFQAFNMAFSTVELNEGLAKNSLGRNLLSLVLVIVALILFVPRYGPFGASLAILMSNVFACLVAPLFYKKSRTILWRLISSPVLGPKYLIEYKNSLRAS